MPWTPPTNFDGNLGDVHCAFFQPAGVFALILLRLSELKFEHLLQTYIATIDVPVHRKQQLHHV